MQLICSNRQELIQYIRNFPLAQYRLHHLAEGSFFLDAIDDGIKNTLRRGVSWEDPIKNIISTFSRLSSTVLDIGAHIGIHTLSLAKAVGTEGTVLAFEPQPKIFRELVMNMGINEIDNVHLYHAGVGDRVGQIELSPLAVGSEGSTGLYGGSGVFVDLVAIDSLNLKDVSLIKVDVEGMEDLVLEGAKETILVNKPVIIIEIMGGFIFETAPIDVKRRIVSTIMKIESLDYEVQHIGFHDYIAFPLKS